jgi:hypothetical protein
MKKTCLFAASSLLLCGFLVSCSNEDQSGALTPSRRMEILNSYAKCVNDYGEAHYCTRFIQEEYHLSEVQWLDVLLNNTTKNGK